MSQPAENRPLSRRALERAIEEAYPVLFHRLHRRYKDPQLAEEVSRDCLSQVYEQWLADPTYFARRDLTSWSSTRANWRAVDRLRARQRVAALPEERAQNDDRPLTTADPRHEPDAVRLREDCRTAWEAIARLDERERKVLIGHYYEGRSDQDLGAELFGASGTRTALGLRVWRLRQKAQARLRDLLLTSGVDPADYAGQAV